MGVFTYVAGILSMNRPTKFINGSWVREPDGACLLMYSPTLWNDPPTALRNRQPADKWYRVAYDTLPEGIIIPEEAHDLKPGEWVRIH